MLKRYWGPIRHDYGYHWHPRRRQNAIPFEKEKLLLPLVGKTVKGRDEAGNEVEHPRTIYTNINGLQIDHELIDGGDNQGLKDWHKWAKPGAVIVFDEVQKVWPPRANGSKVPEDIQELDTHRHKGVDFILITQSVMNIDRHLHALGGRHLHVRRVGNMKAAIVYEWDHVSRSLQYSKSIAKSPWRYSSKVFKLYKSSELHTKVKRSTPPLLWAVLLGLGVAGWGIPTYLAKMKEKNAGRGHCCRACCIQCFTDHDRHSKDCFAKSCAS